MERLTLDALRTIVRLQGYDWSDAELEAMLPAADAALAMLRTLRALDLGSADPTTQYRIL